MFSRQLAAGSWRLRSEVKLHLLECLLSKITLVATAGICEAKSNCICWVVYCENLRLHWYLSAAPYELFSFHYQNLLFSRIPFPESAVFGDSNYKSLYQIGENDKSSVPCESKLHLSSRLLRKLTPAPVPTSAPTPLHPQKSRRPTQEVEQRPISTILNIARHQQRHGGNTGAGQRVQDFLNVIRRQGKMGTGAAEEPHETVGQHHQ